MPYAALPWGCSISGPFILASDETLQNHFQFRVLSFIPKEPGILSEMSPVCYILIGNDFLHVSLAFYFSPVNVPCFLGSCLCPHCEDGKCFKFSTYCGGETNFQTASKL